MLTCAVFVVANLLVKHCLSIRQCKHRECEHFFQLLWEGAVWLLVVNGLVVPKPPSRVSAGMSVSGWNSTSENSVYNLHHDLPVLVTSWPWWRAVLHQDVSKRASDQIPEALGWNPTCRTDRCDLRYGLDQSHIYYRQFRQNIAYLLRKIWAVCHSQNVTFHNYMQQAQKQRDSYVENVGIKTWES